MPSPFNLSVTIRQAGTVDDRYVFLFDRESIPEIVRTLGRFAADPQLGFSWHEAALLTSRIREIQIRTMTAES